MYDHFTLYVCTMSVCVSKTCTCKTTEYSYNYECTKVQNPRYRDVTLNAYTFQHKQKFSLKSIIIELCVGVISLSACDRIRT